MSSKYVKRLVLTATLVGAVSSGVTIAATSSSGSTPKPANTPPPTSTSKPATPNDCIRLNGGDYNACNVGHTGSGNQPYDIVRHHTPNNCIRLNGGDYNACNVGNSGRGDLPYKPVAH